MGLSSLLGIAWPRRGGSSRALAEAEARLCVVDGDTRLVAAAHQGNHEAVALFLAAGDDPDALGRNGDAPLQRAARAGGSRVAETLLAAGARPDCSNLSGFSALHEAARAGSFSTVALLLAAGANPDRRDGAGDTPLHVASRGSDRQALRLLLDAGADPAAANRDGRTPLHMSCQASPPWRVAMAADLIAAGAPWWARSGIVGTAADEARVRGDADLAEAIDRMAESMEALGGGKKT